MSLSPLPYQRAVADILEGENPSAFRSLMVTGTPDTTVLEQALLRTTYRLDPVLIRTCTRSRRPPWSGGVLPGQGR